MTTEEKHNNLSVQETSSNYSNNNSVKGISSQQMMYPHRLEGKRQNQTFQNERSDNGVDRHYSSQQRYVNDLTPTVESLHVNQRVPYKDKMGLPPGVYTSQQRIQRMERKEDIMREQRGDNSYNSVSMSRSSHDHPRSSSLQQQEQELQQQKYQNYTSQDKRDRNNSQHNQIQTQQQRHGEYPNSMTEEEYNKLVMKERETEILEINQKMHMVDEIYKDLAALVDGQQELIDQIDNNIDLANGDTKAGNDNYEVARLRMENPILKDPFGDKLGNKSHGRKPNRGRDMSNHPTNKNTITSDRKQYRSKSRSDRRRQRSRSSNRLQHSGKNIDCTLPLEVMPADMQNVLKAGLNDMKELGNMLITACTDPETDDHNEYAFRRSNKDVARPNDAYAARTRRMTRSQW